MLSKLKGCAKKLERASLTERGSQMLDLTSSIYCWIRIADEYVEEQKGSILIRGERNKACVEEYEAIRGEIDSLMRRMPRFFPPEERNKMKPNKYVNKDYYNARLDMDSRQIRESGFVYAEGLPQVIALLEGRLEQLSTIGAAREPERWVEMYERGMREWPQKEDNDAVMATFRSKYRETLTQEAYLRERHLLHEEFKDRSGLIALHDHYGATPRKLVQRMRQQDYTAADLDIYYEYVHKLGLLDELCEVKAVNPDDKPADIAGSILREDRVKTVAQETLLKEWAEPLMVTNPKNSLFVPYYALWACGLLSNEKIPAFVRQMSRWFPDKVSADAEEQRKLCKALNTEYEKVKGTLTSLPPCDEHLNDHLHTFMQGDKAKRLYKALREAFAPLFRQTHGWK